MKTVLLVLGASLIFGTSAYAKTVTFSCGPKVYQCYDSGNGPMCNWLFLASSIYTMPLVMDSGPILPTSVWRATYRNVIDNHFLTLNVAYDGEISLNASLDARNVVAETSGNISIDVALRNHYYGRGFFCSGFSVSNN